MEKTLSPTPRRSFVRGALVFLGAALGLEAAGSKPASKAPAVTEKPLRLYIRSQIPGSHLTSTRGVANDRRSRKGKLLTRPGGEEMGEYFATSLGQPGAFGVQLADSPSVELQTFRLADGTLFGAGANERTTEGGSVHALLGGTGRYAGARGTFSLTTLSRECGVEDYIEIEINLLT